MTRQLYEYTQYPYKAANNDYALFDGDNDVRQMNDEREHHEWFQKNEEDAADLAHIQDELREKG